MEEVSPAKLKSDSVVLAVDLDESLLNGDLLWECLLRFLLPAPWRIFSVAAWIVKGEPSVLKAKLAAEVKLNERALPWNLEVVQFCQQAYQDGVPVFLVTASDQKLAERCTRHLELFTAVLGSREGHNLKGDRKAELLTERFGAAGFDYVGDSVSDLAVWAAARKAIFVGRDGKRLALEKRLGRTFSRYFQNSPAGLRPFFKIIRPHQWVKNTLVFLPLLAAHRLADGGLWSLAILAAIAFSGVASCTYIINDLLDLDSDREHPLKKNRPVASGRLSIPAALTSAFILGALGLSLAAFIGLPFLGILCAYFVLTLLYSVHLKESAPLDAVLLGGFYTLRIIAGGLAIDIFPSSWLLVFSSTFFFSLALVKRVSELIVVTDGTFGRRGYRADDKLAVSSLGAGSGMVSVLVVALYVNSPDALPLYHRPEFLLLICPVLTYWISRLWLLACRGEIHLDPVVFACKDSVSWVCGFLILGILLLASR